LRTKSHPSPARKRVEDAMIRIVQGGRVFWLVRGVVYMTLKAAVEARDS